MAVYNIKLKTHCVNIVDLKAFLTSQKLTQPSQQTLLHYRVFTLFSLLLLYLSEVANYSLDLISMFPFVSEGISIFFQNLKGVKIQRWCKGPTFPLPSMMQ